MQPVHPSARCVSAWWWLQVWAPADRVVQRVRGQWTTSLLLTGSPRRRRSARWCCCRHAAAGSHRRAGLCRQRCRILCRVPGCCAVRTVWEPGATMQGSLRASAPCCAVVAALCRSRRLYRSVVVAGKHSLKGSSSRHVLALGEGRRAAARACAAADVRHRWLTPHSMGAWRCRPRLQRTARCWQATRATARSTCATQTRSGVAAAINGSENCSADFPACNRNAQACLAFTATLCGMRHRRQ